MSRLLRHAAVRVAREESGFALISALMLILVMLALGLAVTGTVDTQQSVSRIERNRESGFNLSEAALNAQALQLGRTWPVDSSAPSSCNPTSASTACPQSSAFTGGYTTADYGTVCDTAPSTPAWQTSVRDNATGEVFWSTAVSSRLHYDANGDGTVWIRSTGVSKCKSVSAVALVSRTPAPLGFPASVLSANWFSTTNQGKKVVVDTLGSYAQPPSARPGAASQPATIITRCNAPLGSSPCQNYQTSKGQIQPPAVRTDSTTATSTITLSQLQSLERQAKAAGTYWSTCPTPTATQLTSVNKAPVVVEGPCTMTLNNGTVNSATTPGALIVKNGTLTMTGNSKFYGLIYMVNQQGSSGALLSIQGTALVQGMVAIDGLGGAMLGASGTNLIYDPRAPNLLAAESGAYLNKNTFRVLPSNTP
jgi:Tfp pilus assembly protein PilX